MMNFLRFGCEELLVEAYTEAQHRYGRLGLAFDIYFGRLVSIIRKYLGDSPGDLEAVRFLGKTHTSDLCLTTACAQGSESAWEQFVRIYRGFVLRLANHACPNETAARELASNLISDLFAPDRSNRPRIASYDGQSSLATWLRVIVAHHAADERELKWNSVERLDNIPDIADTASVERMNASARASKYRLMILDALRGASDTLTTRERYILVMIYGESLQAKEVARLLGVDPSRVSRQLRQIHRKVHQEAVAILAGKHRLCEEAIKECLADIVENPEHSLLALLNEE
ncbi:MAG TPA: sigma-70 family RNA polymerase sigma factor [Blastocatellia bacterium]